MSMQSESSEQPSCRVPEGHQPIFDGANRDPMVLLPTPVHGNVCDPPVPWHLLCPIEPPMPLQENIRQTAMIQHAAIMLGMQLAEPRLFFWATNRSIFLPTNWSVGATGGYCAVRRIDLSSQHLGYDNDANNDDNDDPLCYPPINPLELQVDIVQLITMITMMMMTMMMTNNDYDNPICYQPIDPLELQVDIDCVVKNNNIKYNKDDKDNDKDNVKDDNKYDEKELNKR